MKQSRTPIFRKMAKIGLAIIKQRKISPPKNNYGKFLFTKETRNGFWIVSFLKDERYWTVTPYINVQFYPNNGKPKYAEFELSKI